MFIELNVVAQGLGIQAKITDGRADGFFHSAKKWDGVCRSRGMNVFDVFGELQAGGVKRAKGVCWDGLQGQQKPGPNLYPSKVGFFLMPGTVIFLVGIGFTD